MMFELKNISAGYAENIVLKDIDLIIKEGEFITILGPNGAGKSTLLKVLAGNIRPVSGSINYKGDALKHVFKTFAQEVSVVHQFLENVLPFTVYDFIRLGRFPHQRTWELEKAGDKDIIENAIEITGISHLRERPLTELSGGERQLASIAQALAQSRKAILLDEPISHLDISHSIQIMDILHSLCESGTTIITVLHDINMASDYCKRILGIKEGGIFLDGTPKDIITYSLIEKLYDTQCVVFENPMTKKPYTFPVPGYLKE